MHLSFREKLYQFLSDHIHQSGTSPSFADMTAAMEISPRSKSLITRNLRALEKEGKVILNKNGRYLSISLSSKQLPLLGRISAGSPIEAIVDNQFIDVNDFFQGSDRFALEVSGNSMIDEGILDGDIIICKQKENANEGEIVVALIDQSYVTLKRISYKWQNMITLIPANTELKPRAYAPERIQIQGIYMGLMRVQV